MEQPQEVTTHALTPEERSLLMEYRVEIEKLNQQAIGAVRAILRLRGLKGKWDLDEQATRLTKV